jgi:hypothetical protein
MGNADQVRPAADEQKWKANELNAVRTRPMTETGNLTRHVDAHHGKTLKSKETSRPCWNSRGGENVAKRVGGVAATRVFDSGHKTSVWNKGRCSRRTAAAEADKV